MTPKWAFYKDHEREVLAQLQVAGANRRQSKAVDDGLVQDQRRLQHCPDLVLPGPACSLPGLQMGVTVKAKNLERLGDMTAGWKAECSVSARLRQGVLLLRHELAPGK